MLKDTIRGNVDRCKSTQRRRLIQNVVASNLLKKYRLIEKAKVDLHFAKKSLVDKLDSSGMVLNAEAIKKRASPQVAATCVSFYLRDDNSRPAAGKRETITLKKEKRHKRFLNDSLKVGLLHRKFLAENPERFLSYSSFSRLRPFYVVQPKLNNRDTTACKIHVNTELKARALFDAGVLISPSVVDLVEKVVCSQLSL